MQSVALCTINTPCKSPFLAKVLYCLFYIYHLLYLGFPLIDNSGKYLKLFLISLYFHFFYRLYIISLLVREMLQKDSNGNPKSIGRMTPTDDGNEKNTTKFVQFILLMEKLQRIIPTQRKVLVMNRSSRPDVFCKKGVLRNLAKFTGKHLFQSLSFNKVEAVWILWISKNTFFKEHLWWLHLYEYQAKVKMLARPKTRKIRKSRKTQKFLSESFKSEFSILAVGQIENLEIRKLRIIFPRFPRFPKFPSFPFDTFSFFKKLFFQYSTVGNSVLSMSCFVFKAF